MEKINGVLSFPLSWQPVGLMQLAEPVLSDPTVKNKYIYN